MPSAWVELLKHAFNFQASIWPLFLVLLGPHSSALVETAGILYIFCKNRKLKLREVKKTKITLQLGKFHASHILSFLDVALKTRQIV